MIRTASSAGTILALPNASRRQAKKGGDCLLAQWILWYDSILMIYERIYRAGRFLLGGGSWLRVGGRAIKTVLSGFARLGLFHARSRYFPIHAHDVFLRVFSAEKSPEAVENFSTQNDSG